MSLITLLLTVVVAFLLSNAMDTFPGLLWGWFHWPQWLLWGSLISLLAWGMGDQPEDH